MNEDILTNIDDNVAQLKNYIIRPFPDKRLFEPDETCMPFYLSNGIIAGAGGRNKLFSFRIPDKMRGVIARVSAETFDSAGAGNPVTFGKNNTRVRIVKGANNDNVALNIVSMPLHGAIQNYDEATTSTQDPGFIILQSEQECRITLEPESYWVQFVNNSGVSLLCNCMFYGWIWLNQPRKP